MAERDDEPTREIDPKGIRLEQTVKAAAWDEVQAVLLGVKDEVVGLRRDIRRRSWLAVLAIAVLALLGAIFAYWLLVSKPISERVDKLEDGTTTTTTTTTPPADEDAASQSRTTIMVRPGTSIAFSPAPTTTAPGVPGPRGVPGPPGPAGEPGEDAPPPDPPSLFDPVDDLLDDLSDSVLDAVPLPLPPIEGDIEPEA